MKSQACGFFQENLQDTSESMGLDNQDSQEYQQLKKIKPRYYINPMLTKCVRITREELAPYIDLETETKEYEAYLALIRKSKRKQSDSKISKTTPANNFFSNEAAQASEGYVSVQSYSTIHQSRRLQQYQSHAQNYEISDNSSQDGMCFRNLETTDGSSLDYEDSDGSLYLEQRNNI